MPQPSSPCIGLCAIDDPSGLCRGCGRSLAEIAGWGGLTEAERLRVMAQLPGRLPTLEASPLDDGLAAP